MAVFALIEGAGHVVFAPHRPDFDGALPDLCRADSEPAQLAHLVALEAARMLLERHPETEGFDLAPGGQMSRPLDIISVVPGLVGAETFAAVNPRNNRKLSIDLDKLAGHREAYRYVFFASPLFSGLRSWEELEKHGIKIWSVAL